MRDLIVFGEDFGGLPSSTQHLITHLSRDRKVLWINSIGLRKPRLNIKDVRRAIAKLMSTKATPNPASKIPSNIKVSNLKTIPAPKGATERNLAKWLMKHQLNKLIQEHGLQRPVVWSSLPTTADLCGELNESANVYYCGDDFSALAGVDHATVAVHENKLARNADLILTASEVLQSKFSSHKCLLLKHGVSYELFSQRVKPATDLPKNKPTIGFYGSLSEWLDYDLINRVARRLPDWNFVFIGKNELSHNPFEALNNIYLLGPRAHSELPSYVQHWQVSWLPFKNNPQIQACNPLKLLEYMAAGQPIITPSYPAVDTHSTELNIYQDESQIIRWLKQPDILVKPDQGIAKEQSWANKARYLDSLLEAL